MLNENERERYARQIILPDFGEEGQMKLKRGSVLIIGAGGLGSPVALYLAAAGVGRLGIVDGDCADLSNLQRQVIHDTPSVGMPKVESAARRISALNPEICVEPHNLFLTPENIDEIIAAYDFVIDATDSLTGKFMINDACVHAAKPLCHGAIFRYQGHLTTILPGSPCYRCLFQSLPEAGQPLGPLGVVAGVIGMLQATEAIKYLAGIGTLLTGTLLTYNALDTSFAKIRYRRSPDCPLH